MSIEISAWDTVESVESSIKPSFKIHYYRKRYIITLKIIKLFTKIKPS